MKNSKTKTFLIVLIMLTLSTIGFSQSQTVTIYTSSNSPVVRYVNANGDYDYTGSLLHDIGRHDGNNGIRGASTEDIWRNERSFYLGTIPYNSTITSATLVLSMTAVSDYSTQAQVRTIPYIGGLQTGWTQVGTGTLYFDNIIYGSQIRLTSNQFTSDVISAFTSSGYFYIGIKNVNESSNEHYAKVTANIEIEYIPPVQVTVQNSIGSGTVKVDGGTYNSGQTFSWKSGTSHTLEASNQSPHTFSQWYNLTTSQPINGNPITVNPTANTIYQANFSTTYSVTVQNSLAWVSRTTP
ncbi:MAG: hypothetical protein HYZ34_03435 [Ignavibacteriae bacterium]|nr:hypothetical protein [Ignavibacteriota bacterium]